jgi:hypothetical protein
LHFSGKNDDDDELADLATGNLAKNPIGPKGKTKGAIDLEDELGGHDEEEVKATNLNTIAVEEQKELFGGGQQKKVLGAGRMGGGRSDMMVGLGTDNGGEQTNTIDVIG